MKYGWVLLILSLVSCGGNQGDSFSYIQKPVELESLGETIELNGKLRQFIAVLDEGSKTLGVLDAISEEFWDLNTLDELDRSAVPVGKDPIAMAVDLSTQVPRVFVADADSRSLVAIDFLKETINEKEELVYSFVDFGGGEVGRTSSGILLNSGRASSQSMTGIEVEPGEPCETWTIEHQGDLQYLVEGTVSGLQTNVAVENQAYESDSGALRFTIKSGFNQASGKDTFTIFTCSAKPIDLAGMPQDLLIYEDQLFVALTDPSAVAVFNPGSGSEIEYTAIPAADSLGDMVVLDGVIYLPDSSGEQLIAYTIDDQTVQVQNVGEPLNHLALDGSESLLFLNANKEISFWNLESQSLEQRIPLASKPGFALRYELEDEFFALALTDSATCELIDLDERKRIDTIDDGEVESSYFGIEFFDSGELSEPILLSVNTRDGITTNEHWQLIYEGAIPGLTGLSGSLAGNNLTVVGQDFLTAGVISGDAIETGSGEVKRIEMVTAETLTLEEVNGLSSSVSFNVKSSGSYVVFGSVSGLQNGRAVENEPYTSDGQEVSLTIRSSIAQPVSSDDFFAFETVDGISPVELGGSGFSKSALVITREGATTPVAYVAQTSQARIVSVDLIDQDVRKSLR